jgi:hypothetical protein
MTRWKYLAVACAAGCANANTETTTAAQPITSTSNDGRGRIADVAVRLPSGGEFTLGATVLDPDPIYLMYDGIKGEVTSSGHSQWITHATVQGTIPGDTFAAGMAGMHAVATGSSTVPYVVATLQSHNITIQLDNNGPSFAGTVPPQDAVRMSQIANGVIDLSQGGPPSAAIKALGGALGLPDPCGQVDCGRLHVTYDLSGGFVAISVTDLNGGGGIANATITACYGGNGAPPPENLVTDPNGVAITSAPAGVTIDSMIVNAVVDGQPVVCRKGTSTCGTTTIAQPPPS